jgi:hypothetical protein
MWSSLLLTDAGSDPVLFSGVSVVPAGDPMMLTDGVERVGAGHVLVVAPRALMRPLRIGVTIAAGRRPDLALTWLASEHAPLALLSALALAQAATDDPAVGVDLTRKLLTSSWSGAWTHSVAKLGEPTPRFGQHLRSMLPGAGFLIRHSPRPAVLSRGRTDDVPKAGLNRVLLVQDGAVPASITQRLSKSEAVSAVRQVVLPGTWASVYGTDRSGQLALMPADPQLLMVHPELSCPACRLSQTASSCPFCRVVNQPLVHPVPVAAPRLSRGNRAAAGTGPLTWTSMSAQPDPTPTESIPIRPAHPGGPA